MKSMTAEELLHRVVPPRALAATVALTLLLAASAQSSGTRMYALMNAKNPTKALPAAQVKSIFMGSTSFWNGVVPVRLYARPESTVGGFFDGVLGTTQQRFQQHWTTRQLSGLGTTPEMVDDVASLLTRVRAAPGALSVVSESEAAAARGQPGVKLVPIE